MLPFHPYADIFPLIEGEEFAGLVGDLKANGLREKIVLFDGAILDGRNRYLAALSAGILADDELPADRPMLFQKHVPAVDGDPLKFVLSKNLHRRHLDTSQRAYAMAEYEKYRHGGVRKQDANLRLDLPIQEQPAETRAELADKGHVSERSIASAAVVRDHGVDELKSAVKQGELAISKAEQIARLPEEQQREEVQRALPNGARAIMSSRQEPDDSLDYFPTPPWATRALIEHVLSAVGVRKLGDAWEPACGEGHIAEVLRESFKDVLATDIYDYGYGREVFDFINGDSVDYQRRDWIITNPPFDDKAMQFVLRALDLANCGVAMFFRWQWLESVGRYNGLFKPFPPVVVAPFVERVNLCKGRWEPDGSTATAYCWIVWMPHAIGHGPTRLLWIPPDCRTRCARPDDVERFTARPVIKRGPAPIVSPCSNLALAPSTDPGSHAGLLKSESEPEDIPAFLKVENRDKPLGESR